MIYSNGEAAWLKDMIHKHDAVAKRNGSIVQTPSDLGLKFV